MDTKFLSLDTIHNIIIGMSDGLTVPFALAAGMVGTAAHSAIIIVASISSIVAGMISMGLGGYLATKSDVDYYEAKQQIESTESVSEKAADNIQIFSKYGLSPQLVIPITDAFKTNPKQWIDFIMQNKFELSEPSKNEAVNSGVVVGVSYVVSGFIPLMPYFFLQNPYQALMVSTVVMLITLIAFGYLKAKAIGSNVLTSILGVILVSGTAAGLAFAIGRLIC